eukprot:g1974.t1
MKSQDVPSELKVEAEGKLYSVPEGVEYNTPTSKPSAENWWEEFVRKVKELVDGEDSHKAKIKRSDPPAEGETLERNASCRSDGCGGKAGSLGKDVRSVGEHSCQICFEHDHSTVMLPCGHGGLCWDCGLQIFALTEECPMCRTKIELLVQSPDMPPVETGSAGGSAIGHGGMGGGGGEGVEMTPTDYEPPLELPDGCHHISLEKFLEVMTGPGLRVRKHHRAGKGSSGLRVLRYSQEADSLTWDSHKILGAAQHVLPMGDVEDSYAVFEAANDDAAAVLYVGLERLRERTQARKDSG